jgi:hypothetical protein
MSAPVTSQTVLEMLRRLSPRERLRVIAQALPETEREFPTSAQPSRSLLGLCADLGTAPTADEIDATRKEAWAGFPRDDI